MMSTSKPSTTFKSTLSRDLRERLQLTASDWAKALSVNESTVRRWEDGSTDPAGVAIEVMRGIEMALDDGADPVRVGKRITLGIGALLCYGLLEHCKA
jgi:DNA-binding XRE family transcriptional regulator